MAYQYKSFENDLKKINVEYSEYLYDLFGVHFEDANEMAAHCGKSYVEEILSIFLNEYLYAYDDESDLIFSIQDFIESAGLMFLDELKLTDDYGDILSNYFRKPRLPKLDLTDARHALFDEVINLELSNPYRIKLGRTITYCVLNDVDEFERFRIVSELLADYDFNCKMPLEIDAFKIERHRFNNNIPDFANVRVGDTWTGGRRMANFIRSLKLEPKPAGKNSRIAQEKSIARSCQWTDDDEKKCLTLTAIYPERQKQERTTKPRKYEQYFRKVLWYQLLNKDGLIETTNRSLLKDMNVLPETYNKISTCAYVELLDAPDSMTKELENDIKLFREKSYDRLRRIQKQNLQYLEDKNLIKVTRNLIIVKDKKRVPIYEVEKIGLSISEAEEMIEEAEKYSFSQIEVYVDNLETGKREKKNLESMQEVRRYYKQEEQKQWYESYLRDNYGWEYTYEQLTICLPDGLEIKEIPPEEYMDARSVLNCLLKEAVKATLVGEDIKLKEFYKAEEEKILAQLEELHDIKEIIDLGLIDTDGVIKNKQYMFPKSFAEYLDTFIEKEMSL